MIVMNKDGDIFDERRKDERRVCKRRDEDIIPDKEASKDDRRKEDRRKEDINKTDKNKF
mgnify:CR=1 FL=1